MRTTSDYLLVPAVLFVFVVGGYFTYKDFFSLRIDAVGIITNARSAGQKTKTYYFTIASEEEPQLEFVVTRKVYESVGVGDSVHLAYRASDEALTRVEVIAGRQRGWVWKEEFWDMMLGPAVLLLGIVALGAMIRNIRHRRFITWA